MSPKTRAQTPPQAAPRLELAGLTALGASLVTVVCLSAQEPTAPEPQEPTVLGRPSAVRFDQREHFEAPVGSLLWSERSERSIELIRFDEGALVEVVSRQAGWIEVRHHHLRGWLRVGAKDDDALPPPLSRTDELRTESLRQLLPELDTKSSRFELRTDLGSSGRDLTLRNKVLAVLEQVIDAYEARYGLEVELRYRPLIGLFREEASYDRYVEEAGSLLPVNTSGHASGGVAALWAGERREDLVLALLVHEVAHLLNTAVFPSELPPWLEEGIAEDLGYSHVDARSRLRPSRIRGIDQTSERNERGPGGTVVTRRTHRTAGPRVALRPVVERWRTEQGPDLMALTSTSWPAFLYDTNRSQRYLEFGFLIRFLLSGDEAQPVRSELAELAKAKTYGEVETSLARLHDLAGAESKSFSKRFARWADSVAVRAD